jgi:hypothetical protein
MPFITDTMRSEWEAQLALLPGLPFAADGAILKVLYIKLHALY